MLVRHLMAAGADVGGLVEQLASDEASVRGAAVEGAGDYGAEAIAPVARLLDSDKPEVAAAAKWALEKIAARAVIVESERRAVSLALCDVASEVNARAGRDWLFWLLSYAGDEEAVPYLAASLDQDDAFDMAVFALRAIGGPKAASAVAQRMPDTFGERRLALINALGHIGGRRAERALTSVAKQRGTDGTAALEALGRLGSMKGAAVAWARMEQGADAAAEDAYLRVAEQQSARRARRMYMRLLANTTDPKMQSGALHGLASAGNASSVELILPHLASRRADVYAAAQNALHQIPDKRTNGRLIEALSHEDADVRAGALAALDARGSDAATPHVEAALADSSGTVRAMALRLLARRGDAQYAEVFTRFVDAESEEERAEAVHGYLNAADAAYTHGDLAQALSMYHIALERGPGAPERTRALAGMTLLAQVASAELAVPYLSDSEVADAAAACVIAVGRDAVKSDRDLTVRLFQAVLAGTASREPANEAAEGLRRLGVEVRAAEKAGFITNWHIAGPFARAPFEHAYPPEKGFDPEATYPGTRGTKAAWRRHHIDDAVGIMDLVAYYTPYTNEVTAYGRAEVTVENAQDVLVKLGSDDAVMCWLNGERIHANEVYRRIKPDQDVVATRLKKGVNVVLIKVIQGGGGWGFCVRLADPSGAPIAFNN
jgi:HEAT repeat protein